MQIQSDLADTVPAIQTAPVAYTRIPDTVLLDPRLTPGQLRIYAVIARRADRDKATAFPSYKTIARDAHVSRTSAINGVKALVLLGYLSKEAQESGQGDPTSNLYTISGEGSQIFVLPRPKTALNSPQAPSNLDHRIPNFVPQAVQPFDAGGAKSAPEQESLNKKKENKIQENGRTRAPAREVASIPAAADPELQKLLNEFQENIGSLTGMAQEIVCQLVEKHGVERVRDATREAVIYEKRSLAYVRRVLEAWRLNGRMIEDRASMLPGSGQKTRDDKAADAEAEISACWPPPGLFKAFIQTSISDIENPAVAAWIAICDRLPEFSRITKLVTPNSLVDNVLTVTTTDPRVYHVLANRRQDFVNVATRTVLGDKSRIQFEMVELEANPL